MSNTTYSFAKAVSLTDYFENFITGKELYTWDWKQLVTTKKMNSMTEQVFSWYGMPTPIQVGQFEPVTYYDMMPQDNDLPPELRWIAKRNAYALRSSSLAPDIDDVVKAIPTMAVEPRRVARVLWVDDNPANNEIERAKLRPFGIVFGNVVSTHEAVDQLAFESYDLVITHLGRERSSDRSFTAGSAFLDHPSVKKDGPPVIVYAGTWAVAQRDELVRRGASDVMANREQLINTVLRMLGRPRRSERERPLRPRARRTRRGRIQASAVPQITTRQLITFLFDDSPHAKTMRIKMPKKLTRLYMDIRVLLNELNIGIQVSPGIPRDRPCIHRHIIFSFHDVVLFGSVMPYKLELEQAIVLFCSSPAIVNHVGTSPERFFITDNHDVRQIRRHYARDHIPRLVISGFVGNRYCPAIPREVRFPIADPAMIDVFIGR